VRKSSIMLSALTRASDEPAVPVKTSRDCVCQSRIETFQLKEYVGQNCLEGEGFSPGGCQLVFHRLHAGGGRSEASVALRFRSANCADRCRPTRSDRRSRAPRPRGTSTAQRLEVGQPVRPDHHGLTVDGEAPGLEALATQKSSSGTVRASAAMLPKLRVTIILCVPIGPGAERCWPQPGAPRHRSEPWPASRRSRLRAHLSPCLNVSW
jgi:hypothetical protein